VERLKEYQAFKEAAEWLAERELSSSARYPRTASLPEPDQPELEVDLEALRDAMRRLEVSPRAPRPPVSVEKMTFSLPERIRELWNRLVSRSRWLFTELLGQRTGRAWVVVTFLAILEMARRHQVFLRQDSPDAEIEVTRRAEAA
ncbi:MAG: segregation/condensation protein A, partial [Candidatus Eremiobacterota bacterium]